MPFRPAASLARVSAVCVLLLGCSLPSITGQPTFRADALVGADTWSFTDVTLRPSAPQALYARDVLDLFVDPAADAGFDPRELPTPSGRVVDFERDVLPHLDGEVVVALSGPRAEPSVTVLLHTNDVEATLRLLVDERQPVFTRDARGATRYAPGFGTHELAGYKSWVVAAESPAALEQVLERIDGRGAPSLANNARYRSVVDRLTGDRIGFGYVDLTMVLDEVPDEDARVVEALHARGRAAYSLSFEAGPEAGVRALHLRGEYAPDVPRSAGQPVSGDALQAMDRLPRGSLLALAGSSIGTVAESFAALGDDERVPADIGDFLRGFAGPYAFGATPPATGGGDLSEYLGGFFFLAQLAADADVDLLDAIVAEAADASGELAEWQYEVIVDDGWLALNAVAAPLQLDQLPQDLLAGDPMYQWVRPGFVQNGTNFYLNVDSLAAAAPEELPSDALGLVRVVGMSAQTDGAGDVHTQLRVLVGGRSSAARP